MLKSCYNYYVKSKINMPDHELSSTTPRPEVTPPGSIELSEATIAAMEQPLVPVFESDRGGEVSVVVTNLGEEAVGASGDLIIPVPETPTVEVLPGEPSGALHNMNSRPKSRVRSSVGRRTNQDAGSQDVDTNSNEVVLTGPDDTLAAIDGILESTDDMGRKIPKLRHFGGKIKESDELRTVLTSYYDDEDSRDSRVGTSVIELDPDTKQAYFEQVSAVQDRGYGRRIYLDAIKQALEMGYDFRSDVVHQSEDAVGMWKWLEKTGIATRVTEFTKNSDGTFTGYYVVNGNNRQKIS